MTPHAYVTRAPASTAPAATWPAGATVIAEVDVAAGFYDQSALTRHFKRCHGITPLRFLIRRGDAVKVIA